jgi:hypothetical protein
MTMTIRITIRKEREEQEKDVHDWSPAGCQHRYFPEMFTGGMY